MQYPDSTKLQAEVDEFMAKFDEKKEQVHNILVIVFVLFFLYNVHHFNFLSFLDCIIAFSYW